MTRLSKTHLLAAALVLSTLGSFTGTADAAGGLAGQTSIIVVGGRTGSLQSLNPQPLPPRWLGGFGIRSLNPQPLPPRSLGTLVR